MRTFTCYFQRLSRCACCRLILLFHLLFWLSTGQAQHSRVISAQCGNCKKSVSTSARVGQKCPHCHVTWGGEQSTTQYEYVRPAPPPSPPPAPRTSPPKTSSPPTYKYVKPAPPEVNAADYGRQKLSVGISLLGESGSWFGVPVRYFPWSGLALEGSLAYAPELWYSEFDEQWNVEGGGVISAGATLFGKRFYKENKGKIKRNGFFTRAGRSFGHYSHETFLSGGWAKEAFHQREKKQSVLLELGGGVAWQDPIRLPNNDSFKLPPRYLFTIKIQWNWFTGSGTKR